MNHTAIIIHAEKIKSMYVYKIIFYIFKVKKNNFHNSKSLFWLSHSKLYINIYLFIINNLYKII